MAELAEHPNVLEALTLLRADVGKGTQRADIDAQAQSALDQLFRRYAFLRDEHPHTWVTELTNAFYCSPLLVAATWKYLRYCARYRHSLAERLLLEKRRWRLHPEIPRELLALVPARLEHEFRYGDRANAIEKLARWLRRNPKMVDQLCEQTRHGPPPPELIADLLAVERVVPWQVDGRTLVLLASPEELRESAAQGRIAVPFNLILDRELDQIGQTRRAAQRTNQKEPPQNQHPLRRAIDSDLVGLAFSGGGIRSATFNLGVLQALSRFWLLKQCDYLSTVSGGGYIGGWFAAWLRRESCTPLNESSEGSQPRQRPASDAMDEMQRRLSPTRSPNPMDERGRPVRYLREYSNYLTPRVGLMSADTWTMFGIYVRNTLLNQVIIVSLLVAALLVPRNWFAYVEVMSGLGSWDFWAAAFCLVLGATTLVANLRRLNPRPTIMSIHAQDISSPSPATQTPPWYATPASIQLLVVAPWQLGAGLMMHWYAWTAWNAWYESTECAAPREGCGIGLFTLGPLTMGALTTLLLGSSLFLGDAQGSWTCNKVGLAKARALAAATGAIAGASLVAGLVATCLGYVVLNLLRAWAHDDYAALMWNFTTLGPAAAMSVFSIAIVAMLGILGRRFPDEHREWWSRLRTFMHIWSVASACWTLIALYVPWAAKVWKMGLPTRVAALGAWLGSTLFGVKGVQADDNQRPRSILRQAQSRFGAFVAPYVCIVGLLVTTSLAIDAVYYAQLRQFDQKTLHKPEHYWNVATWSATSDPDSARHLLDAGTYPTPRPGALHTIGWTAFIFAIGLLFSWRVDVNEFSIHHFYRNRLVRCYLGASHRNRKADWFTGFDTHDDIPLRDFDASDTQRPIYPGPYPILNCALNLVGGQDLAWQERKATSFVFTPRYCGYDVDRAVLSKARSPQSAGYVPTASYHNDEEGPSLGMAMAISGAAANPNMGRATTPAAAFLMTVFNLRLGWWIKNPRHATSIVNPSPKFGLTYTGLELFGGTNDSRKYVNLSDGGHFDNLGVYELVRRGCRYIIISDAGQDGEMLCEDLGNLVRKCRTDFGVEIEISIDRIRNGLQPLSQSHWVLGHIHYLNIPRRDADGQLLNDAGKPLQPGDSSAHEIGYLVYLKPSMTGDEPEDVREYDRRVEEFPHQSTADQWFNESQFESYRKLGMHVAEQLFVAGEGATSGNIPALFEALRARQDRALRAHGLITDADNDNDNDVAFPSVAGRL